MNKIYGITVDKIVFFPAGVKTEDFLPANASNVRENIIKVSEEQYFIRLTRLDKFNRIEFGIQLLPRLRNLKYVVVGTLDDINYLKELQDLSKKLGVEDRVIFTRSVNEDEKRFLLHQSRFCLIANHETFGGPP